MNEEPRDFTIRTLGCRINQYESQALREAWLARGWAETELERAGLVLINSCAVTSRAVQALRALVRQTHRSNPGAEIVIAGCAAQVLGDELAGLPGVRLVVGQARKAALATWPDLGQPIPATAFPPLSISRFERARPVLKIQDGCSHGCAFCIVPLARGPSRSRPVADILAEAQRLLAAGHREIVLGGINLRHFGRDLPERPDLWDLLGRLDAELAPEWSGEARLRLSSLDPGQLGPKALDTLAASRLVCPHLHLSLQSLAPEVLRAMGRGHYAPEGVEGFLRELAHEWPIFGLGADLLAGFPGEEERHVEETLAALERLPLTYAHVFPYSRRPGTRAAQMGGQVREAEKTRRTRLVRELTERKKAAFTTRLASRQRLDAALEISGKGRGRAGVCEFFAECWFTRAPDGVGPGAIAAGRPIGVENGRILLDPLPCHGD